MSFLLPWKVSPIEMKNSQLHGKSMAIKIIEIIKEFPSWVSMWYFFLVICENMYASNSLMMKKGFSPPIRVCVCHKLLK